MINLSTARICVTGGNGFFGRHIVDELYSQGCEHVYVPRSQDYDLRTLEGIQRMLGNYDIDIIIHAAAHAGGIGLNLQKPAELFYDNAIMGIQLMHEAYKAGVKKFVQIGTICEYPKYTPIPFLEEYLWAGYPEKTNAPYGIAKKSLLVMGQAYRQQYGFNVIHLLPVNLYGPHDNFDPDYSHVIPALIRKFEEAHRMEDHPVTLWGTGMARREFLYVEDAAEAVVKATELYDGVDPVNIGTGVEVSIHEIALRIAKKIGYRGVIQYDRSMPDGQPRRCLDTQKAYKAFGFRAKTDLKIGLDKTIDWWYSVIGEKK
ncbi:MAG: GDP-L-fucose synthase [Thaumarchaeota archaeon]|nr:GDP-L-fucose synthase [Nitrososphaerota archaeon]